MRALRLLLFLALNALLPLGAQSFRAGVATLTLHPAQPRNWRGAQTHALRCLLWYPAPTTATELPQTFTAAGLPALFNAGSAAPDAPIAAQPNRLPIILMSHGLGGSADQFGWLAPALARHGYLVLAVNHPGNNALEPYTPEGALLWGERATDLSGALDALLADKTFGTRIDPARIGALGYSLGGETVLALAGARIDQPAFFDFCLTHPAAQTCRVPNLGQPGANLSSLAPPPSITRQRHGGPSADDPRTTGTAQHETTPDQHSNNPLTATPLTAAALLAQVQASSPDALARAGDSFRDARIRAAFALAPAPGQAFHPSSFDNVTIPLTMVAGAQDTLAPPATNAELFAQWLPTAKVAILPGAGHYTFLDTCTPTAMAFLPQLCQEAWGTDRDAIHAKTIALALAFFNRTLTPQP